MTTTSSSILFRYSGSAMVGRNRKALRKSDVDFVPSIDQAQYYDTVSPRSSPDPDEPSPSEIKTNSGNKLFPSARFARHGKIYAWGPLTENAKQKEHVRKRMNICLDQFMPEASKDAGRQVPGNIENRLKQRESKKRKREEDEQWILPHLRGGSPPITTEELTPMLAIPTSYVEIMTSASMRHTLGDDTIEQGLQRTACDLLEGEKPLMQALGRLRDIIRVMTRSADLGPIKDRAEEVDDDLKGYIPPLPFVSQTDNLWRVTQDLTQVHTPPTITYRAAPPPVFKLEAMRNQPELTQLQRLFTCPDGVVLTAVPSPAPTSTDGDTPPTIRYRIDLEKQVTAVNDAMERISELLADCNEYKDRLEEARERIADVSRARKKVWSVIQERAGAELDRADFQSAPENPSQLL